VRAVEHTQADREVLAQLCKHYGVTRLATFGSVARSDFDPETSDIDLTVQFIDVPGLSLARQYFDFKGALETLFGRPVDLVELAAMPDSRLKRAIMRSQVPFYDAAA
jgi:uncharacterized protein